MLKNSFKVVLIQLINIVLSFLSINIVAGNMSPTTYSLVGLYSVIVGFTNTFSQFGLETVMTRKALYWKEKGETYYIKEYFTQSLFLRIILNLLFSPFILIYLFYLSNLKYEGEFLGLMFFFMFSSLFRGILTSLQISIRSQGGYVFSQIIDLVSNTGFKIISLIAFVFGGDLLYLYIWSFMPIATAVYLLILERKNIDLSYISLKSLLVKIKSCKYLWLKSFLDYGKSYGDNLIVSIFFSAEFFGSYSLFKSIEQICKSMIEGFFDTLTQEMVRLKRQKISLIKYERKIRNVKNICIIFIVLCTLIYWKFSNAIISMIGISHYPYINMLVLTAAICSIFYVMGKIEINMIALFEYPSLNLTAAIIMFLFTFLSYIPVIYFNQVIILLLQRDSIYLFNSVINMIIFKMKKSRLYDLDLQI